MTTVLIADDEKNIRTSLSVAFRLEGYEVRTAENGREVLDTLERGGVDAVVLDLQMPELGGMEALRELRDRGHTAPVVILSAHGTVEKAVEAMRLGADAFEEKPPHPEKLLTTVRNAIEKKNLEEENRELREEAESGYAMVGSSEPMQRLYEEIRKVAPSQARVLILGEHGTGKELVAHALHRQSKRRDAPFVRVNCAAIPRDLFESELFGHERGSFTGATGRRKGKFRRAHRGTIFLDEVGEIPPTLQSKILRVIESGEVEPVGSDHEDHVDVRVIAATNKDLDKAVREGAFREDLYYRLRVVTLEVPPLRDHREDIPDLVDHFLLLTCQKAKTLDEDALRRLAAHEWPGNVRELRNLVERLVILSPGDVITETEVSDAMPVVSRTEGAVDSRTPRTLREIMLATERDAIRNALERNRWRMSATARQLGLERSHLYKKLKALGIERPE